MNVDIVAGAGLLLERIEAMGFSPDYQCRSGYCGHCVSTLTSGQVTYRNRPLAFFRQDQVVLCCAEAITDISVKID